MSTTAKLEGQVAGALRRAGYSGNDTTLVVGVSGGPDSSALLVCLHRLSERHGLRLHVAHLNHNFRGEEAEEDARFVISVAEELGLQYTVEKRHPRGGDLTGNSSFEQAARETRYGFLAEVAQNVGASAVAVGHTADDLAETVLLHILRGSGLHGLRGMDELSAWPWPAQGKDLALFRPLLGANKTDTVTYCQESGRAFRDDTGNYLKRFTRNRVRNQLIPLLAKDYNPRITDSLVRLARTSAQEVDFLEQETERIWPQVAFEIEDGVQFRRAELTSLHPLLQRMVLRRGYALLTGDTRRLRESHLTSMAGAAIEKTSGGTLDLPGGLKLHLTYDYVLLSRDAVIPCPLPILNLDYQVGLPTANEPQIVTLAGPWKVTIERVDSGSAPFLPNSPGASSYITPEASPGD
ncbi:MAG: tRNA lysidine(34) synthetase TilS, partial [SAR202 cluster bacterium Io17-Chloro-G9]